MSHHHDGPSQQCWRCNGWFRDDHECLGKPPETVEKFVRYHGAEQVRQWIEAAVMKICNETATAAHAEQLRQRALLEEKIVAGNNAAKELVKLLQGKSSSLPEVDWHLEPDEVKL